MGKGCEDPDNRQHRPSREGNTPCRYLLRAEHIRRETPYQYIPEALSGRGGEDPPVPDGFLRPERQCTGNAPGQDRPGRQQHIPHHTELLHQPPADDRQFRARPHTHIRCQRLCRSDGAGHRADLLLDHFVAGPKTEEFPQEHAGFQREAQRQHYEYPREYERGKVLQP